MIHGVVRDSCDVGRADGFDLYVFIVSEPSEGRPNSYRPRVILHAVAEREGVPLGFSAYGPISYDAEQMAWQDAIAYTPILQDAVKDARAKLGTLVR